MTPETGPALFERTMTAEAFAHWAHRDTARWELVGGLPVRLMVEGHGHGAVKSALSAMLDRLLPPGAPCRPEGDGALIRIPGEQTALSPDNAIDGDPDPDLAAVFEVAMSSRVRDLGDKRVSYFRVPSIGHVVVLLPETRQVVHFRRGVEAPSVLTVSPLTLDPPGVTLDCAALWARL